MNATVLNSISIILLGISSILVHIRLSRLER